MAGAAQQQQGQGDNSLAALWITALVFLSAWAAWYFFHSQIVWGWYKFKLIEAHFIGFFTHKIGNTVHYLQTVDPATVDFKELADLSAEVGSYMVIPTALISIILAILLYFGSVSERFTRIFTMDSLLGLAKDNWPLVAPVSKLDLVGKHIDEGPWAMAETPLMLVKKHNLYDKKTMKRNPSGGPRGTLTVGIKRGSAKRLFTLQMGKPWTGKIKELNPHTRALLAAFAARANRDRDGSYHLLSQISASAAKGKLEFTGADALLTKYLRTPEVVKVLQTHGFVLTMMASMLELARHDGVLAVCDFLWLKPLDRPLWFMLNSVGRLTAVPEIAGPYAHWKAEKELAGPLKMPMVDEAVAALESAMMEQAYIPEQGERITV